MLRIAPVTACPCSAHVPTSLNGTLGHRVREGIPVCYGPVVVLAGSFPNLKGASSSPASETNDNTRG